MFDGRPKYSAWGSRAMMVRTRYVPWLAAFAALGVPVYVAAVAIGGWLWVGYSWWGESVSTLLSRGAPNQFLLVPLFALYNLGLVALAVALRYELAGPRARSFGPLALAGAGVVGLVLFVFPQDPWGAPVSGVGTLHIVVAGLQALLLLLAMGFLWHRLRRNPDWSREARLTAAFLVLGIVLGGFGAASVSAPYAGVAERLSIGVFLVWIELLALSLLARRRREAPAARRPQVAVSSF